MGRNRAISPPLMGRNALTQLNYMLTQGPKWAVIIVAFRGGPQIWPKYPRVTTAAQLWPKPTKADHQVDTHITRNEPPDFTVEPEL